MLTRAPSSQAARRPQPLCGQVQHAEQLAFELADQHVVVIAQPPAQAADGQHLPCLLLPLGANAFEEVLLQSLDRGRCRVLRIRFLKRHWHPGQLE
jgi:hypothetical protein